MIPPCQQKQRTWDRTCKSMFNASRVTDCSSQIIEETTVLCSICVNCVWVLHVLVILIPRFLQTQNRDFWHFKWYFYILTIVYVLRFLVCWPWARRGATHSVGNYPTGCVNIVHIWSMLGSGINKCHVSGGHKNGDLKDYPGIYLVYKTQNFDEI